MNFSGIGSRLTMRRSYSHERLLRLRAWHPIIAISFVGNVLRTGRMVFTLASMGCGDCSTGLASSVYGNKLEPLPVDRYDPEGYEQRACDLIRGRDAQLEQRGHDDREDRDEEKVRGELRGRHAREYPPEDDVGQAAGEHDVVAQEHPEEGDRVQERVPQGDDGHDEGTPQHRLDGRDRVDVQPAVPSLEDDDGDGPRYGRDKGVEVAYDEGRADDAWEEDDDYACERRRDPCDPV